MTAELTFADVAEGVRATIAAYTQALDDGRTDDVVITSGIVVARTLARLGVLEVIAEAPPAMIESISEVTPRWSWRTCATAEPAET